jgi:hypothetical protein
MKYFSLLILVLFYLLGSSQQQIQYSILNNNCAARNSSLGGYPIGVIDEDPSLSIFLPSNLSKLSVNKLVINYNNHFADSDFGMINYNFLVKKNSVFSATIFYNNYGSFEYYDASGNSYGNSFKAADWVFQIGHSRKLYENFQIGLNFKLINSRLEVYNAIALASDISLTYFNDEKRIGGYFLLSNIGTSITNYSSFSNGKLPANSIISFNTKLKHAPVRFHLTYNHLNKWDISSIKTNSNSFSFNEFSKQFFNHIIIASEFLFSDNFNFRFGYDLLSRNELQPQSRPGTTGISWGIGLKIKDFKINYSNSKYHFAGISNNLTIIKSLRFFKPKDLSPQ